MYNWEFATLDGEAVSLNSTLHPLVERILRARGIHDQQSLDAFLYPDFCHEHDPLLFRDMSAAIGRLRLARERSEKVLIHGDYDADGVTAAALLFLAFTRYGLKPQVYIPTRAEGYGIQKESLHDAKELGITLVVTADCGVQAVDEARLAHSLGIDLIITDHHSPAQELPIALAIINPKLPDCPYPFKDLAGVGVAYKLASALLGEESRDLLDYVAVGTVADVVPLIGENRLYVKKGLAALSNPRICFSALMEVASVKPANITAGTIAFMLAPRLNAAGRLEDAVLPLQLLLTQDSAKAASIALELDAFNRARQRIEAQIIEEALAMVDPAAAAIVLYAPNWPPGVVGIVASRLVERFHKPTMLLCQDEHGSLRGSGRSIVGFDLISALRRCQDALTKCGGHPMAAGLTLQLAQLEDFRREFLAVAGEIPLELFTPKLRLQAEVRLDEVNERLLTDIALLAPFGVGNPQPVFASPPVVLADKRRVGKETQHLRLTLALGAGLSIGAVMFNQARRYDEISVGDRMRIAFRATLDEYRGKSQISIQMQDFIVGTHWWVLVLPYLACHRFARLAPQQKDSFFTPAHLFAPRFFKQEGSELVEKTELTLRESDLVYQLTPLAEKPSLPRPQGVTYALHNDLVYNGNESLRLLVPDRQQLLAYYRWLARHSTFTLDDFARDHKLPLSLAYSICATALQIFAELSLIRYDYQGGQISLACRVSPGMRQDLGQSPTYNALQAWEKEAFNSSHKYIKIY